MKKLAIVTTHPIQYNAPLFKLLTERNKLRIKVFYTWEMGAEKFDVGFGKSFKWDIPLLDGYDYVFVSNRRNFKKGFWDVTNPTLIHEIEEWQPNAVLVYGWNYRSHLRTLRYFKGKLKVLFRGDSTLLGEIQGLRQLLRRIFLKWIYSYVDVALYVGKHNKDYFKKHGLSEKQLCFVPHAIDNDRFVHDTLALQEYRKEILESLQIQESTKTIIYIGKFQKIKDLDLLIAAFQRLNAPGWRLILVGNGEEEMKLKEMSNGDPNIFFLPFQNQLKIPAVYRLGTILCLPSRSETWGLAVNEAMACGIAVLVSNKVGCGPDLIHEGQNGYSFESGNVSDLANKLDLLMRGDLKEMGNKSKQIIASWRFQNQADNIERIIIEEDSRT